MYQSEVVAKKMMVLVDSIVRYKILSLKEIGRFKFTDGLSERQIKILIILSGRKENTVSEMAKCMNVSKSTLSIIFSKMIKNGLVVKKMPEDREDQRKVFFEIAPKGEKILEEFKKFALRNFEITYMSFSDEKKKNISDSIEKLASSVSSSQIDFFENIFKSQFYTNVKSSGEISSMAFQFYMFFLCFAEYFSEVLKKEKGELVIFKQMTPNQYRILQCIKNFKFDTVSKLESYIGTSTSTISITVSKLAKSGYVYKEYPLSDGDKRNVFIRLTEKGSEIIADFEKFLLNALTMYFEKFSEEKKQLAEEAIDGLLVIFEYSKKKM